MDTRGHLAWLSELVEWYGKLPAERLSDPVPACPGWRVETVLDHLGRGLGRGYLAMARTAPEQDGLAQLTAVMGEPAHGPTALEVFRTELPQLVGYLERTDPDTPCYTYAGPGRLRFWSRRAAIEMALHGYDVAEALDVPFSISTERGVDAVRETLSFVLPMALGVLGEPAPPAIRLALTGGPTLVAGDGEPVAVLAGNASTVLLALWGRGPAADPADPTVGRWTTLVERAFAH